MGFYATTEVKEKNRCSPVFRSDKSENRLIAVEPVVPTNGSLRVEFAYDYIGRRSRKTVSQYTNSAWSVVSTHDFLWDGWLLISERVSNQASTVTNFYCYGLDLSGSIQGAGGIGGLLSWSRSSDEKTFLYSFDANGNVVQLVDATDGSVDASYEYSAYGETMAESGSESANNAFRFSTKPFDRETGLGYWGMRYYHPEQGRWLSRDPLGEEGGLLLYSVCGNNMINGVDPVGLTFVLDPNMSVEDRAHWRRIIGRFRSTYHGEKMFLHLHVYTKKKIYIYFTKAKPNEDAKALAGVDNYGHDAIFLPNTSRFEDFAHETQHKAEQLCPSKSLDPLDEGLVSEFDPPEDAMPYDTSENRADRFANIVAHEYYSYTPDIKSRSDLRPMPFDPKVDHPIPGSENKRVIPEPYGTKYEGYKYRVGSDEMLMFIEKLQIKRDEIRAEARAAMAAGKEK